MLRATTACTFATSQLPKVVREWCVLYILTWKCASRHNGVHFCDIATSKSGPRPSVFNTFDFEMCFAPQRRAIFIAPVASWLRTRRFSEPTFRPPGAPNHWKNTVFRDFPTFSRTCIFFLLIFSLLTLLTSAFQLSILSEVSLLNFLRSVSENARKQLKPNIAMTCVDIVVSGLVSPLKETFAAFLNIALQTTIVRQARIKVVPRTRRGGSYCRDIIEDPDIYRIALRSYQATCEPPQPFFAKAKTTQIRQSFWDEKR